MQHYIRGRGINRSSQFLPANATLPFARFASFAAQRFTFDSVLRNAQLAQLEMVRMNEEQSEAAR